MNLDQSMCMTNTNIGVISSPFLLLNYSCSLSFNNVCTIVLSTIRFMHFSLNIELSITCAGSDGLGVRLHTGTIDEVTGSSEVCAAAFGAFVGRISRSRTTLVHLASCPFYFHDVFKKLATSEPRHSILERLNP